VLADNRRKSIAAGGQQNRSRCRGLREGLCLRHRIQIDISRGSDTERAGNKEGVKWNRFHAWGSWGPKAYARRQRTGNRDLSALIPQTSLAIGPDGPPRSCASIFGRTSRRRRISAETPRWTMASLPSCTGLVNGARSSAFRERRERSGTIQVLILSLAGELRARQRTNRQVAPKRAGPLFPGCQPSTFPPLNLPNNIGSSDQ